MRTNILFSNFQGIRPKRKELELYLKENLIDIIETFLSKKHNFKIPGYDNENSRLSETTVQQVKEVLPSL